MDRSLITALEAASSLRATCGERPEGPVFAHWHLHQGAERYSVLSRIAPAGVDYTRRANLIAHHIVLDSGDRHDIGPASLMQQMRRFRTRWDGPARVLEEPPLMPAIESVDSKWADGAANRLAKILLKRRSEPDPRRSCCVLVAPSSDPLQLAVKIFALLPVETRWDTTFLAPATENWSTTYAFDLRIIQHSVRVFECKRNEIYDLTTETATPMAEDARKSGEDE